MEFKVGDVVRLKRCLQREGTCNPRQCLTDNRWCRLTVRFRKPENLPEEAIGKIENINEEWEYFSVKFNFKKHPINYSLSKVGLFCIDRMYVHLQRMKHEYKR